MQRISNRPTSKSEPRDVENLGEHIWVFKNFFKEKYIDDLIETFEEHDERGLTLPRSAYDTQDISRKKDEAIFLKHLPASMFSQGDIIDVLENEVTQHFEEEYPIIKDVYKGLFVSGAKLQKTRPSGGYHIWHSEHNTDPSSNRTLLAWGLFLNTFEEGDGGELEFLYQSKRLKPTRNHLVVWPAGFTHMHRGNPPLKGDKYLLTGWLDWNG